MYPTSENDPYTTIYMYLDVFISEGVHDEFIEFSFSRNAFFTLPQYLYFYQQFKHSKVWHKELAWISTTIKFKAWNWQQIDTKLQIEWAKQVDIPTAFISCSILPLRSSN